MNNKRIKLSKDREAEILVASHRRCCLCYFLDNEKKPQGGQIAHINHNPRNNHIENLVFLCLNHHDEYDSKTSQSKGFTEKEVTNYRDELYKLFPSLNLDYNVDIKEQKQIAVNHLNRDRSKKLQFLDNPWKLKTLDKNSPLLYAFKSQRGFDGICRIERIDLEDGRVLFICEDIDENPGVSSENSIECIALQFCENFQIYPNDLLLVQHFSITNLSDNKWYYVEFKKQDMKEGFLDPSWKTITTEDWEEIGYRPRSRPKFGYRKTSLLMKIKK